MRSFLLNFLIAAFFFALAPELSGAQSAQTTKHPSVIAIAGQWSFQLDSADVGITQQWYKKQLPDKIILPGSITGNHKGYDVNIHTKWTGSIFDSSFFREPQYAAYRQASNFKVPFWLQPVKYYKGAAWYQKNISIPANWKGKHVELYIERSHWETTVWVDDRKVGMQNSLATAQVFDLSNVLSKGPHVLTVRVDNRIKEIDFGQNSHSLTDHTQGNWNGMIGQLSLIERPKIYIHQVQLYPNLEKNTVAVNLLLNNEWHKAKQVTVTISVRSNQRGSNSINTISKVVQLSSDSNRVVINLPMGKSPLLWDEFHPGFYRMIVSVRSGNNETDQKETIFGMRDFRSKGTQFTINGRPIFLRGALECAAFPLTGYPPTNVQAWVKEFKVYKSYGLNHIRFHSWCPPEAAFVAADSLGIYLQVECSSWANQGAAIGEGKPLDGYIYEESGRIVQAYGNHPSFCMLTYGNEPAGKDYAKYLGDFVSYWKAKDSRRLYTTASGWPMAPQNDYNVTSAPRIQHWLEGLKSIINSKTPSANYDWSSIIAGWQQPTVSHEIGQWCVYPDFTEIAKYTGVLKAKNYEIFKDKLQQNGLLDLAPQFLYASGKLQALCYKADIEAALRTPGFGGFQLLGLYDFPGQGTALVGVVNVFGGDKGYINSNEYRHFCNAVVPLALLPKMVYLNNETLNIPVEVAQFGAAVMTGIVPSWEIKNESGAIIFSGRFTKNDIPLGNAIQLGKITQALAVIKEAAKLPLTVHIGPYQNSWDIFVYPHQLPETDNSIYVTQTLDQKARQILQNGGKVLLSLKRGTLKPKFGGDIAIGFSSIFWNTAWTNHQPPSTLGILCDPNNAALKQFPTQSYSNYQWWDAMTHSNAICLDSVARGLKPIVRVIDDWVTARSLGLVFECKAGRGKLMVSGIDLLDDNAHRPEARQLLYSLEHYMGGQQFKPKQAVDLTKLSAIFP